MNARLFSSLWQFNKSQRIGLLAFLTVVVVLQLLFVFANRKKQVSPPNKEKAQWVSKELIRDSVTTFSTAKKIIRRPFNPNFITDYKGYQIGMSLEEIDRLLAFRKTNRFVNSAAEFQKVTGVSDSLLKAIAPYFKFPEWVTQRNSQRSTMNLSFDVKKKKQLDMNLATAEDLKQVYGIGAVLSERIIAERAKIGAFVSMVQLEDIYGLRPEVLQKLNEQFAILDEPKVARCPVNSATIKELMRVPYFNYGLAKNTVVYRSMHGPLRNAEDLTKISGLPIERINIIALYLDF